MGAEFQFSNHSYPRHVLDVVQRKKRKSSHHFITIYQAQYTDVKSTRDEYEPNMIEIGRIGALERNQRACNGIVEC